MKELQTEQLDQVGGGFDPLNGPPIPGYPGGIDPWDWERLLEELRRQNQHQQ